MPGSFESAKAHALSNKTVLTGLAVMFVLTMGSMVVSAYCADHIHKSACVSTDVDAKAAYQWSWVSAVMAALAALGSLGGIAFVMFFHHK
jgi:hypothetical protein